MFLSLRELNRASLGIVEGLRVLTLTNSLLGEYFVTAGPYYPTSGRGGLYNCVLENVLPLFLFGTDRVFITFDIMEFYESSLFIDLLLYLENLTVSFSFCV